MATAMNSEATIALTRELTDAELDLVIGGVTAGGGTAPTGAPGGENPHLLVVIAIIAILIG